MSDDLSRINFEDPRVWELLDGNHQPAEFLAVLADGTVGSHRVVCEKDALPWPCPVRVRLDDMDQPSRFGYGRRVHPRGERPPRPDERPA